MSTVLPPRLSSDTWRFEIFGHREFSVVYRKKAFFYCGKLNIQFEEFSIFITDF